MSHQHDIQKSNVFTIGLVLNTAFTIFELVAGLLTGSLALVADGIHNLTDSLTLAIAFVAEKISRRAPDEKRSYGYGRAKIIASLLNAGILVAVALFIGIEAIQRLQEPHEVPGMIVAVVATVGIIINGYIAFLLSKQKHNLNARSAYVNMFYDTLSSVGALLAGLAIVVFDLTWLDSVVGIGIAGMLLIATVGIMKDAFHILLEGIPADVDLRLVKHSLQKIEGVVDVDDVHAWMIDNDYFAFSCHLIVDEKDFKQSRQTVEYAKRLLRDKYNFRHSTLEVEFKDCTTHEDHND